MFKGFNSIYFPFFSCHISKNLFKMYTNTERETEREWNFLQDYYLYASFLLLFLDSEKQNVLWYDIIKEGIHTILCESFVLFCFPRRSETRKAYIRICHNIWYFLFLAEQSERLENIKIKMSLHEKNSRTFVNALLKLINFCLKIFDIINNLI